ncbi:MAG: TatD family hydrolase [Aggregatilineales bacterium]
MLIDTHCHINFNAYDDDRADLIERASDVGVKKIIIPAIDLETGEQILNLVDEYDGVYGAVGIHPNSTADFSSAEIDTIRKQTQHAKILAIGEIGLDYHWDKSPKAKQAEAFEEQLALAAKLELPVIIHNREASEDVMAILESWITTLPDSLKSRPGVLHSFSAPRTIAERALDASFYLGFTGPITYKNADDLRHIAARVPLDRLLVETDGPFLTPTPFRGKRNEPAYIPYIVERLASLKTISVEKLTEATTANAIRLFKIP